MGQRAFYILFAYQGSQYFVFNYLSPVAPQVNQYTRQQWLTLCGCTFSGWHRKGITICFTQKRRPKIPWWLSTTFWRCDYPGCMTIRRSHCIDADFEVWAGMVVESVLPIQMFQDAFRSDCNLLAGWLCRTHDQNCWHLVDAHFQDLVGSMSW
jgi:hypothetical protein